MYEQIQQELLRIIDSLRPELDSTELAKLSGAIALPWSVSNEALKAQYGAKAVLAVCSAASRVYNSRGYNYGLERGLILGSQKPPVVELISLV